MGELRNAHKILVGNPEGKRPLGRPRHRWKHKEIRIWVGFTWLRILTGGWLL
jgi:hypothetical protein